MSKVKFQVELQCREGTVYKLLLAIETARAIACDTDPPLVLLAEPGIEQLIVCTTVDDLEKYFEKKEIPHEPTHIEAGDLLDNHGGGRGDRGQGS